MYELNVGVAEHRFVAEYQLNNLFKLYKEPTRCNFGSIVY